MRVTMAAFALGMAAALPLSVAGAEGLAPDFMRVQHAGQAGWVSAGAGYSWWHRRVEASANYGYVPAFVADRRVHVISERNSVSLGAIRLRRLEWEPALLGVAANVSLGNRYQLFLPAAQRDYYWPDALYFWGFAGTRLTWLSARPTHFRGIGAQCEVGTLNQYLKSWRENEAIGLGDILSVALSAQIQL